MLKEAVYHMMDSNYAYALDINTLVIRIRTKKKDIKRCILFYGDRCYEKEPILMDSVELKVVASDAFFDYFEVEFKTKWKRVCYYFLLDDGKNTLYYYGDEFHEKLEHQRSKYYQYAYIREKDIIDVPVWAQDSVMYQIFPDSFATKKGVIQKQKKTIQLEGGICCESNLGGSLVGVTENLPYIKELGANCIYLTPIFKAISFHKYNTIDYYEIDPCFGTKEDFKELVNECHKLGIRIILDGVFNHTSPYFFAFKDILDHGEKSKYKDWYLIDSFPVKVSYPPNYEAFAYVKDMPRLNTANEEVINYFMEVGKYWIKEFDIDGWRLDVANEIDHDFWVSFRRNIKSVKKDALLVAEIWENAQSFLSGDQFDSSMDYNFMNVCEEFFSAGKISVTEFDQRLANLRMRYKKPIQKVLMNLLDSHDVRRFLYTCGGNTEKLKLSSFFQMTYEGMPSIFYGDEVGLSGVTELEYRRPMEWEKEKQDKSLLEHYKKLISIRNGHAALRRGAYRTEVIDEMKKVYGFTRIYENEKVLVLLNNSEFETEISIAIDSDKLFFMDLYSNKEISKDETGNISVVLPAYSGAVIPM
ncbi:alpha-glycosidase [Clostridium oryzae]|uniref:Neopullulanase 2 n=1 Tax=Clostridium oryzae TaxID=1450648 RepID=A0A1V4ILH2_9CLOT|nr:alpha-glycosidase [Clostridium oryzae]OPJ60327.1 neopullulanase 2 [Clostridium oryzae]